jgi:hypothetical protein
MTIRISMKSDLDRLSGLYILYFLILAGLGRQSAFLADLLLCSRRLISTEGICVKGQKKEAECG